VRVGGTKGGPNYLETPAEKIPRLKAGGPNPRRLQKFTGEK